MTETYFVALVAIIIFSFVGIIVFVFTRTGGIVENERKIIELLTPPESED